MLKSDTMPARPFPLRLASPAFLLLLVACGGRGRRKSSRGAREHSPDVSVERYLWERSGSAMKLVGHKTESIYRRYAIVSSRDLAEGVAKLAALHGSARVARSVLPLSATTSTVLTQSTASARRRAQRQIAVEHGERMAEEALGLETYRMARGGIEPPTRGFSVRCSTN